MFCIKREKIVLSCLAAVIIALCCVLAAYALPVKANADSGGKLPDFTEDFEGYEAGGFIENTKLFNEKWDNNVLRGGEPQGMDAHLKGVAQITDCNGNKVLALNNTAGADTFFYIGPVGDYRVKNFTATMRVKFLTEGVPERSWIGFSFRKKNNVHYTGTNNLMFVAQRYKDGNKVTGHAYAVFDGGSPSELVTTQALYGDKLQLTQSGVTPAGLSGGSDSDFIEIKLNCAGSHYTLYADGEVIADCTFNIASFDYFGYLSINGCQCNVYIDDVNITVNDTSLPPEVEPLETPVVTVDTENKRLVWEYIDGALLYSVKYGNVQRTVNTNSFDLSKLREGEYEIYVTALSDDPFYNKNSEPAVVKYTAPKDETQQSPPAKNRGCSSAAAYGSIGAAVIAAGGCAALLVKKRKGELK